MAGDDVELVERAFALLDSDRYEEVLPLIDERFEMVTTSEVASEPDTYRGPDGVRRWFESFLEAMDSVRVVADRIHPVREWSGDHRVRDPSAWPAQRDRGRAAGRCAGDAGGRQAQRLEFFTTLHRARAAVRPDPS